MDIAKPSCFQNSVILYIASTIYKKKIIAGGMFTHTDGVIRGFSQLNIPVTYASTHCLLHEQITSHCAHIHPLTIPWPFSIFPWKMQCLFSNFFFTWQLIKINITSLTHIYQRYTILNCTGILLSRLKKIPCTIEYNGSEAWVLKHWSTKRWFSLIWLVGIIEHYVLKKATYIVVVSQALKDELIERGITASKILVNPNGVDEQLCNPQLFNSTKLKATLPLSQKMVFGFIGTFNTWHGISIIAQLIKALKKKAVHFILIGDGPLRSSFIKELECAHLTHLVTLPGMLQKQHAMKYLALCDIFLCPTQKNNDGSRFFGSPTKLFEYMSLAKPIIASNLEQLAEIIHPAITYKTARIITDKTDALGLLADPDSPGEFIALAHMLLDLDKNISNRIGLNARHAVLAKYTWKHHVHNILQFIKLEKSLDLACSVDT